MRIAKPMVSYQGFVLLELEHLISWWTSKCSTKASKSLRIVVVYAFFTFQMTQPHKMSVKMSYYKETPNIFGLPRIYPCTIYKNKVELSILE